MQSMKLPPTFSVFPVINKKPLVEWGIYSKRLPSQDEKNSWINMSALGEVRWGIATGPVSKILVVDDDGGLDLIKHPMPRTWTQNTPRGGKHYFLRWTAELENKITTKVGILPGVDVRGDGGFAVFYGFEKPYWTMPIAYPPKWLIDLLPNRNEIKQASTIQDKLDEIKTGNRNDTFTRLAGSLRARGYEFEDIYSLLLPKAKEVGFSEYELQTICKSICRYPIVPRASDSMASEASCSIEEFLKEIEKVEWVCEGLIAKRSIGFVVGLPETGKTFMLIDLAVACAKGGLWLNKFPVKKAKVLFIDQERFKGETQRRFKAVISAQGISPSKLQGQLLIRCGTSTRLNLQHSFDAFKKEISEIRPDLIIIDSFVAFHTCEENNRKDIQTVLERIKELRTEFGCTFLFIHHENKMAFDKEAGDPSISQMAGSIAIPAAAETVLTVRKQDSESSMVYHTKSTLSSTSSPFLVKIVDTNETKTKIKIEAY